MRPLAGELMTGHSGTRTLTLNVPLLLVVLVLLILVYVGYSTAVLVAS